MATTIITAALVQALRARTGAGMMDCKGFGIRCGRFRRRG